MASRDSASSLNVMIVAVILRMARSHRHYAITDRMRNLKLTLAYDGTGVPRLANSTAAANGPGRAATGPCKSCSIMKSM